LEYREKFPTMKPQERVFFMIRKGTERKRQVHKFALGQRGVLSLKAGTNWWSNRELTIWATLQKEKTRP